MEDEQGERWASLLFAVLARREVAISSTINRDVRKPTLERRTGTWQLRPLADEMRARNEDYCCTQESGATTRSLC